MIKLVNEKQNYEIYAPTSIKQLEFDKIAKLVNNVELSEHYAIIMIAQGIAPISLALVSQKPDADVTTSVSTFFIRANDPNNKIKGTLGDKVITSRSDLERSIHLPVPCAISLSNLTATVADNPSMRTMLTKGAFDTNDNPVKEIVSIAFKIVPLTSIYAVVNKDVKTTDAFRHTIAGS